MIFNPKNITVNEGFFKIEKCVTAKAHSSIADSLVCEMWRGFTFRSSEISFDECEEYIFLIGNAKLLPLGEFDYTVNVTEGGIAVSAKNRDELMRALFTLFDRFELVDDGGESVLRVGACEFYEKPAIKNRMVHFCVFPDTALWELQKFVRLAAALKYTHLVIEFWGMYKYACLDELSWPHAFKKEELAPIINEARVLGLEIIPMFNHWGHAAGCRSCHGKHVVLDQNPSLQYYFDASGWCWDIKSTRVRELLKKVRRELCELCGDGSYFHIGCDEADGFVFTKENVDFLIDYLNEISADMKSLGRRVFVWGDMFISKEEGLGDYICNAPSVEWAQYIRKNLSRDIIIADWQYDMAEVPMKSALVFKEDGFDVALCPWDRKASVTSATVKTVEDEGLFGVMHTTWHTLSRRTPYVSLCARLAYDGAVYPAKISPDYEKTAAILRKVFFVDGDYEKAGWGRCEIGVDVT